MAWGEPSVTTTISTLHRRRRIYRRVDAVALSREAMLEEVARLFWDDAKTGGFERLSVTTFFQVLAELMPESEAPRAVARSACAARAFSA